MLTESLDNLTDSHWALLYFVVLLHHSSSRTRHFSTRTRRGWIAAKKTLLRETSNKKKHVGHLVPLSLWGSVKVNRWMCGSHCGEQGTRCDGVGGTVLLTLLAIYLELEAHLTSMAPIILQQHVIPSDLRLVEPFVLQRGNDLKHMSRLCMWSDGELLHHLVVFSIL